MEDQTMTTTPEPQPTYWPPQPTPAAAPAPKRPMWLLLAATAVLLLIGAGIVIAALSRGGGLSEQSAQRACRTAFENEWKTRVALTTAGSDAGIVVSLQGIDTQETWKTDAGYGVNAVVNYSLTTGIIDPVNDTVAMSCAATGTDDNVSTTITNRG